MSEGSPKKAFGNRCGRQEMYAQVLPLFIMCVQMYNTFVLEQVYQVLFQMLFLRA